MTWRELILDRALKGTVWAVALLVSLSCLFLYHEIVTVPRDIKFETTLYTVKTGLNAIMEKLNTIDEKVQTTEKNYAFLKGKLNID